MTFGEKLQRLRARAGLSQDQLAELLDVSRQAVSKWERNEAMPEAEKIVRISRQFGVSTDYLLLEEREEPETARAQTPAGLWGRIKQWYRNKGYLLAWILVAPVLDIAIYAEPVKKVFAQGAFAAVSNSITAVVVGGLLVLAYTRTIAKKGSLDQE